MFWALIDLDHAAAVQGYLESVHETKYTVYTILVLSDNDRIHTNFLNLGKRKLETEIVRKFFMNQTDIVNLSLEQSVEALGDPTHQVFQLMYDRYPDLKHFKNDESDWESYMMQEIFQNFLELCENPESALMTIREMAAHHRLIGVTQEIFQGMYQALFEVLSPSFHGPHRDEMIDVWQESIDALKSTAADSFSELY